MRIVAGFLLGVAGFLAAAALIYAATSGDETGSVLLLLAAGLAVMIGGYLLTVPAGPGDESDAAPAAVAATEEDYLPASSIWPFWIGLGGVVLANGVALGLWGLIPGGILSAAGIVGFARQSRRRD